MPYIDEESRHKLLFSHAETPGELNYDITQLLLHYLAVKGESYQTHAEIISSLECAKIEWYRKKTSIYEDKKELENGKIY